MRPDDIRERFQAMKWRYADKDPHALAELERRIADAARKRGLLTYSDLVRDVRFNLPNLRDGDRTIDVSDWEELDRAIVGDFLGYISQRSYERHGFLSSALVVTKLDGLPSEGFYTLIRDLGLISSGKTDKAMYLWSDHVAKAHTWYTKNRAQAT
jgi:hypothetical protein